MDTCAALSATQCYATAGCWYDSFKGACRLNATSHPCAARKTSLDCYTATDSAGNKMCQVQGTCVSPCTTCGECIKGVHAAVSALTGNPNITISAPVVAATLSSYCSAAGYSALQCAALSTSVLTSPGGNLGLRPARVCKALGACNGACQVRSPSLPAGAAKVNVSLCSSDGTTAGSPVGATNITIPTGACRSDTDCAGVTGKTFCDYSNGTLVTSACMCRDGDDACVTMGTCISQCDLPGTRAFLAEVNSAIKTCTADSGCAATEQCSASADCVTYTCDGVLGLRATDCSGVHFRRLPDCQRGLSCKCSLCYPTPCGPKVQRRASELTAPPCPHSSPRRVHAQGAHHDLRHSGRQWQGHQCHPVH